MPRWFTGLAAIATPLVAMVAAALAVAYPGGPVIVPGAPYASDFPDPAVIRVGDVFYAFGTSAGGAHIPVMHSTDPTDPTSWIAGGPGAASRSADSLPVPAAWGLGHRDPSFPKVHKEVFAPGLLIRGDTLVLYYAIRVSAQPSRFCLSVAVADIDRPAGPFVDRSSGPIVCDADPGGSFDPEPFVDSDGTSYLLWKSEGSLGGEPSRVWIRELSAAGRSFVEGSTAVELLEPSLEWEGGIIENPSMVLWRDEIWLFYSAEAWRSADYATGVARCRTVLGPCIKSPNPLLARAELELGPGGATAFLDGPRSGDLLLAYHAWSWPDANYPFYPRCEREQSCDRGQRRLRFVALEMRDRLPAVAREPIEPVGVGAVAGYWLLGLDGTIWTAGSASHLGEPSWNDVRAVDIQATPEGDGYWVLDRAGTVWAFGTAPELEHRQSRADWRQGEVAAGLACRSAGNGCWIVSSLGRVTPMGDTPFLGDLSALALRSKVTAIAGSPRGSGYSLLMADGSVHAYGDQPISGPHHDGRGRRRAERGARARHRLHGLLDRRRRWICEGCRRSRRGARRRVATPISRS